MTKRTHVLILLLTALVCFAALFSFLYIAAEINHDCTGEDCPVCFRIHACVNTLKTLLSGLLAACALTVLAAHGTPFLPPRMKAYSASPVTLCVKLSD